MSMKRQHWLFVLALVIAITGLFANGFVATSLATTMQDIEVFVNDVRLRLDDSPVIQDGRTLVPMRAFFEALGADVSWNAETRTAIGTRDGIEVRIPIGSKQSTVNGQAVDVDVPAQIVNGRTFIPLRFVGEALGDEVKWDGEQRQVNIITNLRYHGGTDIYFTTGNQQIALGTTKREIIEILGEPISINHEYCEVLLDYCLILKYPQIEIKCEAPVGKEGNYDEYFIVSIHSENQNLHGPRNIHIGESFESVTSRFLDEGNPITSTSYSPATQKNIYFERLLYGAIISAYYPMETGQAYIYYDVNKEPVAVKLGQYPLSGLHITFENGIVKNIWLYLQI